MKGIRLVAAVLSMMLCFGNASAANPDALTNIKRVFIEPVKLPEEPFILGRGAAFAAVLAGPLAGVIANSANSDIESAYAQLLADNQIDVAAYVAFELMDRLSAQGYEIVSTPAEADAVFSVEVAMYGLTGSLTSSGRFPTLAANFILTNRNGKRLWKERGVSQNMKEVIEQVPVHPVDEYFSNPKLLDSQIRQVNSMVVSAVLAKLN